MGEKIAVAMSGGVDSFVAAHLLAEKGCQVFGVHFTTGRERRGAGGLGGDGHDPHPDEIARIARQMGVELMVVDVREAFDRHVVDYFVRAYAAGETPNPCLACNAAIKFGEVLSFAEKQGASRLATGHYAGVSKDKNGRCHLTKGADAKKDQSYFLGFLTQRQLAAACFPLADMTKQRVKEMAAARGLGPVSKKESQDVCFIKGGGYGRFLASQPGFSPKPGLIETMSGDIVGRHDGLCFFTVGQRRGINRPGPTPYYVVELDWKRNRLKIGAKDDLFVERTGVKQINWIHGEPGARFRANVRLRYRHEPVSATIYPSGQALARVEFQRPQRAVAPGQGAIFYDGPEVLGGGYIDPAILNQTY